MPGLFIRRQAESLTSLCDVAVIYIHPATDGPVKPEVEFREENQVRVIRIYYRTPSGHGSVSARILGLFRFYRAAMRAVNGIRQFCPDLIHAHILTRMAFIGWRVSRKFGVPLVISEHWSRYFVENGTYRGGFHHLITRFILRKAEALVVVSESLRKAMQLQGLTSLSTWVIPNVVDSSPEPLIVPANDPEKKILVHISCFEDRSKNISGFLRVLASLAGKRQDFLCMMVGDGPDFTSLQEYARTLKIFDTFVVFTGLKTGLALQDIVRNADFMVLSSHYETFATVVAEGLGSGLPVVATEVGIVPEVINASNGIIVPPGNEAALEAAVDRMLDISGQFDRMLIREGICGRFTRETVGKQIFSVYEHLLKKTQ